MSLASQISALSTRVAAEIKSVRSALNGKEASIAAGTATQYWRGDKTWETLNLTGINGSEPASPPDGMQYYDTSLSALKVYTAALGWALAEGGVISVRAATTASITLSATQTVDGVALAVGDAVFVKDQNSGNGVFIVQTGSWTRAVGLQFDANTKRAGGVLRVREGTSNKNVLFSWGADLVGTGNQVDVITRLNTDPNARVASTTNIATLTLAATPTMDGVTLNAGDQVLLKNQTTVAQNGVYLVTASGTWVRAPGHDSVALIGASLVKVRDGAYGGGSVWAPTLGGGAVLESTGINYFQVYGVKPRASYSTPQPQASATQSFPANTTGNLRWTSTIDSDSTGVITNTAAALNGDGHITLAQGGLYEINMGIAVGSNSTGNFRNLVISDSGAVVIGYASLPPAASGGSALNLNLTRRFAAGATFTTRVNHDATAALGIYGGSEGYGHLNITRIGD